MSLGGTAIAFGAMVDVAIVVVENTRKQLEPASQRRFGVEFLIDSENQERSRFKTEARPNTQCQR
jgi:Cu/Ag efflux pump CusA